MSEIVYNTAECSDYPDFYEVPDFTRYGINIFGDVIDRKKGRLLSTYISRGNAKKGIVGGYALCRLTTDTGIKRTFGRHRLLCMVFKPKPTCPSRRIVNHINGVPGDDRLENLEWCSYSENTKHAYDNGLYPNKVCPTEVLYPDNNVVTYTTSQAAADALGWTLSKLHTRLKSPGRVGRDGYAARRVSDKADWFCFFRVSRLATYYIRNLKSGLVIKHDCPHTAARTAGVTTRQITECVHKTHKVVNGFEVCRGTNGPWTDYTDLQIQYLSDYPYGRYPKAIKATNVRTGEVARFASSLEAGKFFSKNRNSIYNLASAGHVLNGWQLEQFTVL